VLAASFTVLRLPALKFSFLPNVSLALGFGTVHISSTKGRDATLGLVTTVLIILFKIMFYFKTQNGMGMTNHLICERRQNILIYPIQHLPLFSSSNTYSSYHNIRNSYLFLFSSNNIKMISKDNLKSAKSVL
jgi:hypothetical protein